MINAKGNTRSTKIIREAFTKSSVGRNKPVRAIARTGVSGERLSDFAGNTTARYAWVALFRPTIFLFGMLDDIILEASR